MRVDVLDCGYLDVIETWGSDERIVEAARMSTGKGFLGWGPKCPACGCAHPCGVGVMDPNTCRTCGVTVAPISGDEKLLAFLWQNKHATPFEMAGAVLEIQAPIFVFREWHRHRTQSYNEMSARYTPLPDVNYMPSVARLTIGSDGNNRQAGTVVGAGVLTEAGAEKYRTALENVYVAAELLYQEALAAGVPKELARIHLPVGRYSRMRASANLRNWLAFLTLRMAPQAQWEIRQYANAVHDALATAFPRSLALFDGAAL